MPVKTGGPVRGLLGRWLMRVQAVQGILQLVGIAVTAASTLTTALVAIDAAWAAPWVLGAGLVGAPAFAWGYVELGLYNRKNRENADRGRNWAGPDHVIGQMTQAAAMGAAVRALDTDEEPRDAAEQAAADQLKQFRDGVDVDDLRSRAGKSESATHTTETNDD